MKLHRLDPKGKEGVVVVIETPRGSRHKYDYDTEAGVIRLSKTLPSGQSFPFDFGFIPRTLAADGDPLDVLVLMGEASFPGCVLEVDLLGVIEGEQVEGKKKIRNDRLVAIGTTSRRQGGAEELKEVNQKMVEEITEFFISYNKQEGRVFKPMGYHGAKRAKALVRDSIRTFKKSS